MGKWGDVMCPSVNSFSTHTSGARGLKFARNNHHIGGSKFTNQSSSPSFSSTNPLSWPGKACAQP